MESQTSYSSQELQDIYGVSNLTVPFNFSSSQSPCIIISDDEEEVYWANKKERVWAKERKEDWVNEKEKDWANKKRHRANEKEGNWPNEKDRNWSNEKQRDWSNEKEGDWAKSIDRNSRTQREKPPDFTMEMSSKIRNRPTRRSRGRRGRKKKRNNPYLMKEQNSNLRKIDVMSSPLHIHDNITCQYINPHFNDKTCKGGEKSSLFWLDEIRNVYMHLSRSARLIFVQDMIIQAHACLHNGYHKAIIAALRIKEGAPRSPIEKLFITYREKNSLFVCTCELGCQISLSKEVGHEHLLHSEVSTNSSMFSSKFQGVDNSAAEVNWKPFDLPQLQARQAPSAPKWIDVVAKEAFEIGKAFSVLFSICEYLGVIGPSLHSIIMRALDFGSDDTASMKAFFKDDDTLKIMKLVEEKLTTLLREFYQDTIKREMFMSAIGHIKLILSEEYSSSSKKCQQQHSKLESYQREPQDTGTGYISEAGNYGTAQGGTEYIDSEYSRKREQDYTRGRQPESIDYGHQYPGNADHDKNRYRIGDYDRDKYGEPRRPIYYDAREMGNSSDNSRQFSEPYRIEEHAGSIDVNEGPDRGPLEYNQDFSDHDRHLLPSDYGKDTPESSGYGRNPQRPFIDDRLLSSSDAFYSDKKQIRDEPSMIQKDHEIPFSFRDRSRFSYRDRTQGRGKFRAGNRSINSRRHDSKIKLKYSSYENSKMSEYQRKRMNPIDRKFGTTGTCNFCNSKFHFQRECEEFSKSLNDNTEINPIDRKFGTTGKCNFCNSIFHFQRECEEFTKCLNDIAEKN